MSKFGMDFSKLLGQIDQTTAKKQYDNNDDEFWKPTPDKAGNASAVIRFLPNKDAQEFPFVRIWHHGFKDPETGRWYIENSLTTLDQQDYIAEVNRELWNTGIESNKEIVRARKRKLSYISNILVVKDTANPENVGQVKKFKFGQKIFDKIVALTKPDEALGVDPINPFDPESGANFLLTQKKVGNFPNFDDSKFGGVTPIGGGKEDAIKEILSQCYDLSLEVAPEKFKSYEDLKRRFLFVIGQGDGKPSRSSGSKPSKDQQEEFDADDVELDQLAAMAASKPAAKPKAQKATPVMDDTSDDDDDAAFFKSLVD